MDVLKSAFKSNTKSKIGALLAKDSIKDSLKVLTSDDYGGAPLLGLNGLVVKTHGNSTHKDVRNAIIQCVTFSQQQINEKIKEKLVKA